MLADNIIEVASGCFLVHGSSTNWVLLTDGEDVTLVDTGYPGDRQRVEDSLTAIGRKPGDVAAILITHAHVDHLGSAGHLGTTYGIPVLMHEEEVPHARRDFLHQVSTGTVLANGWRPGVLPWAVHAIRSGGTRKDIRVPAPRAYPQAPGPLGLPGAPVPVPTPGHTLGHTCYHVPGSGLLLTGDALISGHPTSTLKGPQLLPSMFDHDRARTVASLDIIGSVDADVLLPGHGPVHRGSASEAASRAKERVTVRG